MLTIIVPGTEVFNETTQEFATVGDVVLELEHSLVALSKWEELHEKPFLVKTDKTTDEIISYVRQMVLTPNVPAEVFGKLSTENFEAINSYINAKRSATWFSEVEPESRRSGEVVTSELIYYWMTGFQIPFKCENWHLNRLFALIRICSIKQSKPKKMSRSELAARQREINARRKAELGTTG